MAMEDIFGVDGQPGSIWTPFTNPSVAWDAFKNGRTNILNKQIADENLALQKEEQQWQHDFATDERDYNRALQQQLFEREDTAIERQAEQLSKVGINPLSQELNGLNAGQPIGNVNPNSVTPQNQFQMQDTGLMSVLSALGGFTQQMNQVSSGSLQRDSLALENDKKMLENLVYANEHGIQFYNPSRLGQNKMHETFNGFDSDSWYEDYGIANIEKRDKKYELEGKKNRNIFNFSSPLEKNLSFLGSDSFLQSAEKVATRGAKLFDNIQENYFNNNEKKAQSLLRNFFNLFF